MTKSLKILITGVAGFLGSHLAERLANMNHKVIGIDNEALGLVLGRDPLTLVQLGLESKQFFLIKLNRETYKAPNLIKVLSSS